jgi:hypothetical protein
VRRRRCSPASLPSERSFSRSDSFLRIRLSPSALRVADWCLCSACCRALGSTRSPRSTTWRRYASKRLRFCRTVTDRLALNTDRSAWLSTPSSSSRSKVSVYSPTRWRKSASPTSSSSAHSFSSLIDAIGPLILFLQRLPYLCAQPCLGLAHRQGLWSCPHPRRCSERCEPPSLESLTCKRRELTELCVRRSCSSQAPGVSSDQRLLVCRSLVTPSHSVVWYGSSSSRGPAAVGMTRAFVSHCLMARSAEMSDQEGRSARAVLGHRHQSDAFVNSQRAQERPKFRVKAHSSSTQASLRCVCPLSKAWRHLWQITSATGVVDSTLCRRIMTAAPACRLDIDEGFLRG